MYSTLITSINIILASCVFQMPKSHANAPPPLCFADSFWAYRGGKISYDVYIANAVAHFRGVRHPQASGGKCQDISFEPFAASIRSAALEGGKYEPLERTETDTVERLFQKAISKSDPESSTIGLFEFFKRKCSAGPSIVQPLAVLSAREGRPDVLKHCLDNGAVIDRNMAKASSMGKGWNVERCEWTDPKMKAVLGPRGNEIAEQSKGRTNADGRWTGEQLEEWFGDINW